MTSTHQLCYCCKFSKFKKLLFLHTSSVTLSLSLSLSHTHTSSFVSLTHIRTHNSLILSLSLSHCEVPPAPSGSGRQRKSLDQSRWEPTLEALLTLFLIKLTQCSFPSFWERPFKENANNSSRDSTYSYIPLLNYSKMWVIMIAAPQGKLPMEVPTEVPRRDLSWFTSLEWVN